MTGRRHETWLGLGALACTVSCGMAPAAAESMDELYAKAKPEKAVVFYSGGPVAPYEAFAREFEQRFPDLKVSITGGFSNVLNEKINTQLQARKLEVDMAFFQTLQDFVAWKKQGVLLSFKPEGFDQIAPVFRDPDGAFTTTKVNPIGYAYNSKAVTAAQAPRSALDFLKAQFVGKLITCYPADDDATLYQFYTIVQKYGWSFMDKYMAAKPAFVQGHLGVARGVAAGSSLATFDSTATAAELKRSGQPIEFLLSAEDPTPIFTLTAGIFKDAPHPNAAKLYLSWFLAKEQQSHVGSFSSRLDVPPPEGLQPLTSYRIANNYRELMTDERLIADLRKRFEAYTGPPVNKGGVR